MWGFSLFCDFLFPENKSWFTATQWQRRRSHQPPRAQSHRGSQALPRLSIVSRAMGVSPPTSDIFHQWPLTSARKGHLSYPKKCVGAASTANVRRKAGIILGIECCYAAFPSNVTGSHVSTELRLKRLRTKSWGVYWKISLKPFGQWRLYHPIFSSFLPAYRSATMNLIDTSSEGNGK